MAIDGTSQATRIANRSTWKLALGGSLVFGGMACLMYFATETLLAYLLPDSLFARFIPTAVISVAIGVVGFLVGIPFVAWQLATIRRLSIDATDSRWRPFESATLFLLPILLLVLWFEIRDIVGAVALYRDPRVVGVPSAVARHVDLWGGDLIVRSVTKNVCMVLVPGYVTTSWLVGCVLGRQRASDRLHAVKA